MVESIQHVLGRVRKPRVHITYDVEIGGAVEKKELPFVVGVIADLAGKTNASLPSLKERKFVEIDRDNFNEVMRALRPRLAFSVEKTLLSASKAIPTKDPKAKEALKPGEKKEGGTQASSGDTLAVELEFETFGDFSPVAVVQRVPALAALYEKRVRLNDLIGRVDGNDALNDQLLALMQDDALRGKIAGESKGDNAPETDKIITAANFTDGSNLSDEKKKYLRLLIQTFALELGELKEKPKGDVYFFVLQSVASIDQDISTQLDKILHHTDFQRLEGSWRGLHYLVSKSETSSRLKIRLLQISWDEFSGDLERAVEFDQSVMFKKVYEEEYGTFGGAPYSCMVLDFAFGRGAKDMDVLGKFAGIAAAAHVPTLAQPCANLFGLESFRDISAPRDLSKVFESSEFVKWNGFRANPDSRYITLLLPRVLMRPPYGKDTLPVDEFNYTEHVDGETNERFCWGSPAYVMAQRITDAFAKYSWTAAIRGVEGGGLVEDLPTYTFKTSRGDQELKCPTEIVITDRREKELSDLGFLALCHCKGTDYAAFFGAQTTQKPKKYNTDDANANALISARLPYVLNASRFAHYVKAIMRDKVGSFMSRADVQSFLQNWLGDYVLLSDTGSQELKAKFPLREGKVVVQDEPGKPGSYKAVLFLRPHFQLEELTVSLRLVAKLPESAA